MRYVTALRSSSVRRDSLALRSLFCRGGEGGGGWEGEEEGGEGRGGGEGEERRGGEERGGGEGEEGRGGGGREEEREEGESLLHTDYFITHTIHTCISYCPSTILSYWMCHTAILPYSHSVLYTNLDQVEADDGGAKPLEAGSEVQGGRRHKGSGPVDWGERGGGRDD